MDKKKLLQAYLGPYLAKPSKGLKLLLKDVKIFRLNIIHNPHFNQVISYLLVKDGRQNYKVMTSTQVIDIFLGKEEDIPTYRDIVDPVVIVIVSKAEMDNQRRWTLLYQFAMERRSCSKGLTIITDTEPPNLSSWLDIGAHFLAGEYKTNKRKQVDDI